MDKKALSEQDICSKFITPAIQKASWDFQKQIREQVFFTKGKIIVQGKTVKRGEPKFADYILYHKSNLPLAVIEAKDNNHSIGAGMQQALDYAEVLDIPFVYSSNGDGFIEHDRTRNEGVIEKELSLEDFPSPTELYARYKQWKNINSEEEKVINQDYFYEANGKSPHYFQQVAINRTVEAIIKGQDRILLVMATGTGKTYVASQVIWRLWKVGVKKRILFLADRNILVDQAKTNDFKQFGDKMVKITNHRVDKAYEIYLALYQGVSGLQENRNIYKQFSPDFFDLVVVDECHRGSASEDSAWREILEYYSAATQIGMTATPAETKTISNMEYFSKPVYVYSLKQGIDDGFLAPYKVIRITIDKDVEGYRPESGKLDKYGNEIPDEVYEGPDFDKRIVIDERTQLVAKKITEFLQNTNPYDKTIVFCVDIDHAERMRIALVNENAELISQNRKYIMRITGDEKEGKREVDNFIDPESRYPVIVTTSKLLTTGVDTQTVKLIVLDANIQSMTEFKQIIGRGTRVREDFGKQFFSIMDFRNVTRLFADKDFDGEPVQIYEPKPDEPVVPPEIEIPPIEGIGIKDENGSTTITCGFPDFTDTDDNKPRKYYVNGVNVKVINERVQFLDANGRLITESLKDYSRKNILREYSTLDKFISSWKEADKKQAIIDELTEHGVMFEELQKESKKDELDAFDLICHIAYDKPPMTRRERINNVHKRHYFAKYGPQARAVLNALLDKYAEGGIGSIEDIEVLNLPDFQRYGTLVQIVNKIFGGRDQYERAVKEMEHYIYL